MPWRIKRHGELENYASYFLVNDTPVQVYSLFKRENVYNKKTTMVLLLCVWVYIDGCVHVCMCVCVCVKLYAVSLFRLVAEEHQNPSHGTVSGIPFVLSGADAKSINAAKRNKSAAASYLRG